MGIINILDKQTANMIAAGEVVDRPAGALKELMENCIDAGSTSIKVEIKGGGISMMRVVDNGSGILRDDVPKTLLRHATSKIATGSDLGNIATLGFRGEALAAISSVSRMEMITRSASETAGTKLISDENGVVMEDVGCPVGTAITVKDLFYNTPARARFMKKDSAEAAACAAVCEKIALSHPAVAVSFTSEGERKFATPGDGDYATAIYSVFGSAITKTLKEATYELGGVKVTAFINAPDAPRASRNMQVFFVNGRFVRSKTVTAALEEGYRSYIPSGKFPAGVIYLELDVQNTDVNVHPAKLEIRFADEKKIFEAVYYCVRNALTKGDRREETAYNFVPPSEPPKQETARQEVPKQMSFDAVSKPSAAKREVYTPKKSTGNTVGYEIFSPTLGEEDATPRIEPTVTVREPSAPEAEPEVIFTQSAPEPAPIRIVGELYGTYVIAETGDSVLLFDKHAAHERILYEQLRKRNHVETQQLFTGITVNLTREMISVLANNLSYLLDFGFDAEVFGDDSIIIRAVPVSLSKLGRIDDLMEEFAKSLADGGSIPFADKVDRALYTMACKAAVKAGQHTGELQDRVLAEQLIADPTLRCCPHGRPFVREISKRDIDKLFDR